MICIDKAMAIGGLCEAFIFCDIINARVNSPVDGLSADNFKSTVSLFNGEFFNDVLNNNVIDKIENPYYEGQCGLNDDKYMRYYPSGWLSVHYDFSIEKRLNEFKHRIELFNQFNKDVQNGTKNMFYVYALGGHEEDITIDEFNYACNNLPSYVLDNLLIVGAIRHPLFPLFTENFRCISYNYNLSGSEGYQEKVNQLWEKY